MYWQLVNKQTTKLNIILIIRDHSDWSPTYQPLFHSKDFTGNDRQKEEKYMERTDEVIYQRAAEEHIRRPPLWHDDEVDSVRVRISVLNLH